MKAKMIKLFSSALATALIPAAALATPPSNSPYYTDKVQSYVQDQVSIDMEELNSFLCLVSAMAPDQLINKGAYLALVDTTACKPKKQNNDGNVQTANYITVEVDAARKTSADPMTTKVWADNLKDNNATFNVRIYASASQAPSKYAPYGTFRMDYCKEFPNAANSLNKCSDHIGFISASSKGLSFYTRDNKYDATNGVYYDEFSLQLSASSTTTNGSGIVIKSNNNDPAGKVTTKTVLFSNNDDFFYRDDSTTAQCFDRASNKSEETVWRYGLYTVNDGKRLQRESGFPISYTCTAANSANCTTNDTYYGYISYWGLYMPVTMEANAAVKRKDYSTTPPTEISYTLKQSGGTLNKYSTTFRTLDQYNKQVIEFYPYADVRDQTQTTIVMPAWQSYQIYWDSSVQAFYLYAKYTYINSTYQWVVQSPAVRLNNTDMKNSTTYYGYNYGFYAWSQAFGGMSIVASDWLLLDGATPNTSVSVATSSQDKVYPSGFANIGNLRCLTDCMTSASISGYNTAIAAGNYNKTFYERPRFEYNTTAYTYDVNTNSATWADTSHTYKFYNLGNGNMHIDDNKTVTTYNYNYNTWAYTATPVGPTTTVGTTVALTTLDYTLNATSGNLVDPAGNDVIQTQNWDLWGEGRYVDTTVWNNILNLPSKCNGTYPGTACTVDISNTDIDLLAAAKTSYTYYNWYTGPSYWSHTAYLVKADGTSLKLYPPLNVTYTVPNQAKYGNYKNSKHYLSYGEFGNLWGLPYICIDTSTNAPCNYSTGNWNFFRWVQAFSIPTDTIDGVVYAGFNPGDVNDPNYIPTDTPFLAKGLEREIRLMNTSMPICKALNLDKNIIVTKLPSESQWLDPVKNTGDAPVLPANTAPRVIHGIVQY